MHDTDPGAEAHGADVVVPAGPAELEGHLTVPAEPQGVVVFVHGSGSSRHSPRDRKVAAGLHLAGLATLQFDLLATGEVDRSDACDLELPAARLGAATRWARARPELPGLRIGYFGSGTGAAVALRAAAEPGAGIAAVVSRGGRPELVADRLGDVLAPTLLLVGGADEVVGRLNRQAAGLLRCPHRVRVVTGATHLFEEPGALDVVARAAQRWFVQYLALSWARPVR